MEKNTALETLNANYAAMVKAQVETERQVHRARAAGASWSEIAERLGTSKQNAQQKYSKSSAALIAADRLEDREVMASYAAKAEAPATTKVDAKAPAKTATRKVDAKVPAPAPATRTEYSILDSPFGWSVTVPEGAQPGTGKGPHACPACGSTNHKGATNHRVEFNTGCTPTKYDPPYIAKFMRLVTKAS